MSDGGNGTTKKRVRSPAYPAFSLEACIEKANLLYQSEDSHWAPLEAVASHWDYKVNNSSFLQYISAMKQFGLLDEEGSKESRKLRLAELALDIVTYDQNHSKWIQAIENAALRPRIHQELWAKYDRKLPSQDVSIRVYLIREREEGLFNKDHVDGFIKQFRDTISFAKLGVSNKIGHTTGNVKQDTLANTTPQNKIAIGTFVQWTSQGVDQFDRPRRVLGVSDSGRWAFVEGSKSGLPVEELNTENPPATDEMPPLNPHLRPWELAGVDSAESGNVAKERTTLDEGPVLLTMPVQLGTDSVEEFEYWVKGIVRRMRRKAGLRQDSSAPDED